jgi:Uma2 family endonuclease
MTIEEIKKWKRTLGMTSEEISSASGIPLSTVQKIFSGVTRSPRKSTMDAILSALKRQAEKDGLPFAAAPAGKAAVPDTGSSRGSRQDSHLDEILYGADLRAGYPDRLEESAGAYHIEKKEVLSGKKQGEYTLDDYYALPDERRVELIDGVIYDMPTPALIHQKILGELFILFRECMDRHEGKCEVYLSPCDVRLDRDNRTMVQPDLLVVCEEYDIGAKSFDGAPALTLEILSPSTRSKDMLLKLYKYANAGVREYWIVDPDRRTVLVYDLEHEEYYPDKYSFEDNIPIRISGGECSIDFARIMRRIERFYKD